jgi:hypothetical protein
MHRVTLGIAVAALLAGSVPGAAQGIAFVAGGGLTFPTGNLAAYAQTGWMAMGAVVFAVPVLPLQIRLEGLYGQNAHDGPASDKTVLYGSVASAIVRLGIPRSPLEPYVMATVGAMDHHYAPGDSGNPSSDEWKGVVGGGAGLGFHLLAVTLFAEGRYLLRSDTRLVALLAGLRIAGP